MNLEETESQASLISYHGFIFPFEWCYDEQFRRKGISGSDFLKRIAKSMKINPMWDLVKDELEVSTITQYNEQNYFYDFVRKSIIGENREEAEDLSIHYQFKIDGNLQYKITVDNKSYLLQFSKVELKFYAFGVGSLILHVLNESNSQADPEDILSINQYGRRLYAPYFNSTSKNPGADAYYNEQDWAKGLEYHAELPSKSSVLLDGKIVWKSNFANAQLNRIKAQSLGIIAYFFPDSALDEIQITPALDDRMFVVCWYGNNKLSEQYTPVNKRPEKDGPQLPFIDYHVDDWWYRYVFVDGKYQTCQNDEMVHQLLKNHTYNRWLNYGTLWGIARYSWVTISQELPDVPAFIVAHIRTLYVRMAEIALLQRACVLKFSDDVTSISALKHGDRRLNFRMDNLFRNYLKFVNRLHFREVTAQEQGIEMYDMLRRSMRLEEQVKDLDAQIKELHNYASNIKELARNEKLDMLTYIASVLGVPSFISTVYSTMGYKIENHPWWPVLWVYVLSVIFVIGIVSFRGFVIRLISVLLLVVTFIYAFCILPAFNF